MASLFEKAVSLIMGNAHALLDKAIDMNSVPVIKHHIRQLEGARDDIASQTAIQTGRVNSLRSEIDRANGEMKKANEDIDLLLGDDDPSNDARAVTIQLRVDALTKKVAARAEDLKVAQVTAEAMGKALTKIKDRHAKMVEQVRTLEDLERSTRAKEGAASALKKVGQMASAGGEVSVDNVEQRLRDRASAADAVLNQQLGDMAETSDETVELARAREAIAKRRAALKGTATAAE